MTGRTNRTSCNTWSVESVGPGGFSQQRVLSRHGERLVKDTVTLVPYGEDILAVAARRIIASAASLPDLTRTVILLPDLQFAPRLRRQLLQQASARGQGALLGPLINTTEQWLCEQYAVTQQIPGRARRELMLVEVLKQHPAVFEGSNPWQISACLVALFDELTLNRVDIPDDLAAFTARLQTAYGIQDRMPPPLGIEAGMVHQLWRAWHVQLNTEDMLDPGIAMLQRLAMSRSTQDNYRYYLVGLDTINGAELEWITDLLADSRAECILYRHVHWLDDSSSPPIRELLHTPGNSMPAQPSSLCLDTVFQAGATSPGERAAAFGSSHRESPLRAGMSIFAANSAEQEARAIDLQVRQWLLEDKQPIGIITEDRRLARRVRALLERAGITLQDTGGWALSTTSAAAALERWLETIEEDFAHQPLLDVLKSPFVFPASDREQLSNTVYRLEQDIMLHENIARGLERYRHHIDLRLQRLSTTWTQETAKQLHLLLNQLDQAAEPLRECISASRSRPAALLEGLRASLEIIGIWEAFGNDPAGQRIISEWQLLHAAVQYSEIDMSWIEFRTWLGSALERHVFRPATADSPVSLLTLQQAQLGQFNALVMGACDREYLPAAAGKSPFFNDPVRRELGLPVWPEHYQLQLHRFRRVLESAPQVLMTWHQEENGEMRLPSPWLEAIQTFHRLAWQDDLLSATLGILLNHPATQVKGSNRLPPPQAEHYPAPALPAALLPASLSVSAHRHLIDCPYKFFAAYGLQLKPRETVREALEKADYGSLVHQALEIFHSGRKGYPDLLDETLTRSNRSRAIALLEQISDKVFAQRLEDNIEHRAWLRRWRTLIPEYIDWQIKRQVEWTFTAAEQDGATLLTTGRTLKGRVDRIDSNLTGKAILDYKTGGAPKQDDVDSGEEVQLPSYALLTETLPARVEYLYVDGKVRGGACLEGQELATLAGAVRQRLVAVLKAIEAGSPLPAWGDVHSCRYCEMDGLCRQQAWLDTPQTAGNGV
jgi:ATP-dependent helicase/nuclease subunit B